ncbi:MAG: hypothetical protein IKP41_03600 [Bacteroidaceae bacterium]|nr:hypothetical protein [Bacteroidaceae bacterium]
MSILDDKRLMVGGVVSTNSSELLHAIKKGVAKDAATAQMNKSLFQVIVLVQVFGIPPSALNVSPRLRIPTAAKRRHFTMCLSSDGSRDNLPPYPYAA